MARIISDNSGENTVNTPASEGLLSQLSRIPVNILGSLASGVEQLGQPLGGGLGQYLNNAIFKALSGQESPVSQVSNIIGANKAPLQMLEQSKILPEGYTTPRNAIEKGLYRTAELLPRYGNLAKAALPAAASATAKAAGYGDFGQAVSEILASGGKELQQYYKNKPTAVKTMAESLKTFDNIDKKFPKTIVIPANKLSRNISNRLEQLPANIVSGDLEKTLRDDVLTPLKNSIAMDHISLKGLIDADRSLDTILYDPNTKAEARRKLGEIGSLLKKTLLDSAKDIKKDSPKASRMIKDLFKAKRQFQAAQAPEYYQYVANKFSKLRAGRPESIPAPREVSLNPEKAPYFSKTAYAQEKTQPLREQLKSNIGQAAMGAVSNLAQKSKPNGRKGVRIVRG